MKTRKLLKNTFLKQEFDFEDAKMHKISFTRKGTFYRNKVNSVNIVYFL